LARQALGGVLNLASVLTGAGPAQQAPPPQQATVAAAAAGDQAAEGQPKAKSKAKKTASKEPEVIDYEGTFYTGPFLSTACNQFKDIKKEVSIEFCYKGGVKGWGFFKAVDATNPHVKAAPKAIYINT